MYRGAALFAGALAFEAGLGAGALGLARWTGAALPPALPRTATDLLLAIAVAVPPLLLLSYALRVRSGWLARVRALAQEGLADLLAGRSFPSLLLLGAAAGWGEELLFRGLLQTWAAQRCGVPAGIALAALAFGALHGLSREYAAFAAAVGAYLGIAAALTGSLAGPILAHAAYDVAAFAALRPRAAPTETIP